jgi:hypothetical protein
MTSWFAKLLELLLPEDFSYRIRLVKPNTAVSQSVVPVWRILVTTHGLTTL